MNRTTAWIAAIMLTLTGCSKSPVEYQPLTFKRYQPIYMAVSSIEIVEEYKSPMQPPYIEHLIPYSPTEALRIWVRDRLRAGGGKHTMQIIVRDGRVTSSGGRYDAKLEVEMRIYGAGLVSEASVFTTSTRTTSISSGASDGDRNRAFRRLITDMMEEFNAEMEKNMFQYMGSYISFAQSP